MPRWFEVVFAIVLIVVFSPLMALLGLAVLATDGRPVIFRQVRIGKDGREFELYKFRSMRSSSGPLVSATNDSRITTTGRILRKTKLDELPQLFNVLMGDMSFVGPRPEVAKYVGHYTAEQRRVLSVRPGITDPASIEFRNEAELLDGVEDWERVYIEQILPRKLELSLDYLRRKGFLFDLKLLLKTLVVVVTK